MRLVELTAGRPLRSGDKSLTFVDDDGNEHKLLFSPRAIQQLLTAAISLQNLPQGTTAPDNEVVTLEAEFGRGRITPEGRPLLEIRLDGIPVWAEVDPAQIDRLQAVLARMRSASTSPSDTRQ